MSLAFVVVFEGIFVKIALKFLYFSMVSAGVAFAQSGGPITTERLTITGPDSTGDVSGMSVMPNIGAPANSLARAFGDLSGFKAPGSAEIARLDAVYNVVNARTLFNSPQSGQPADWLGNGAGGSSTQYAYGSFGQAVSLSGIGDVGVVGATRTEDIPTNGPSSRLPIGLMGWGFNFKTVFPQTAWGLYVEARRKVGAGQIHGAEINVTDLGDGSDRIVPTAMKSGNNAVYAAYASGVNIAAGGNVRPGAQTGWDGAKEVTQSSDVGVALAIYNNAAKFEKGIILGEDALVGCNGTGGPNVCTGFEMGRGTGVAWIDGSPRQGATINSDVSPSGNGLRMTFSDYGAIIDGYGGATLNVIAKSTDVNGVQVLGGSTVSAPARLIAAGSPHASLGLGASGGGVVQMQSVLQLVASTVAKLPVCDAFREGGMAYVTDAAAPAYRKEVTGGGSVVVPVFCTGASWEAH